MILGKDKGSRWRMLMARLAVFFAVMGPGIITGNVDNDAGGITTYSIVGARYQYTMLWGLLLTTIALIVIQEMTTRMGIVTGKGLADLIRERFGVRMTFFAMVILIFANLATTISDFAGIAAASEILGFSRYIMVPLLGFIVWFMAVRGNYRSVERIMLILATVFITYIISGIMAKPDWAAVWHGFIPSATLPNGRPAFTDTTYLTIFIAMIGTTITPWMQFYQQGMIVDKGLGIKDLKYARIDTYAGAIMTDIFSFFMIVACGATLFPKGVIINDASQAAAALIPLAGRYAGVLFAIGLLNASTMAASVLPMSTAYAVSEAFGWEGKISKRWHEAPQFFILYTVMILIGVITVLNPNLPLVKIMLFSQTLNGILLPLILVFMLILVNDKRLMGRHTNNLMLNIIAWGQAGFLIVLTVALTVLTMLQNMGIIKG